MRSTSLVAGVLFAAALFGAPLVAVASVGDTHVNNSSEYGEGAGSMLSSSGLPKEVSGRVAAKEDNANKETIKVAMCSKYQCW